MPVFTNRGLKVRLEVPYVFALITRLQPHVTPFKVFQTTEAVEGLSSVLGYIAALVALAFHAPPLWVGVATVGGVALGCLINTFGLFIIPGLVTVGRVYSVLSGRGILLFVLFVVAYFTTGLWGAAAYLAGITVGFLVRQVDDWVFVLRSNKALGRPLTTSERSFFHAYSLQAVPLGVDPKDIDVAPEELEPESWGPTFIEFAEEWPELVQRWVQLGVDIPGVYRQ